MVGLGEKDTRNRLGVHFRLEAACWATISDASFKCCS